MDFDSWLRASAAQGNPLSQRLTQHFDTIMAQQAKAQGGDIGAVKDATWNAVVGTLLGLPLEAGATTGKAATGALAAGVGQLAGQGPDTPSGRAYQAYQQGGGDFFQGGRAANEALASGSKGDAFVTGLLNATLDPTNFLAGPASEASKAAKAGKVADIAGRATEGLSPEFHAALDTLTGAQGRLSAEARPALGDIFDKYDALKQLGPARQAVQEAADTREEAGILYKATQQTKTQAAREAKQGAQQAVKEGNLAFPTPEAQDAFVRQATEDAKTAVTEGIVGLPQRGQTFKQYMAPHEESYRRAVAYEQQARKDILQALSAPQTSSLSQADVGLLGATGVPEKALQRMTAANAVDMNIAGDVLTKRGKVVPGTAGLGGQVNEVLAGQEGIPEGARRLATTTALDGSQPLQDKSYAGVMVDLVKHAFGEGWQAQRAAMQQEGVLPGLKQAPAIWKQNLIQTPRNILMDWAYMRAVLANEGVRMKALNDAEKQVVRAILSGEQHPMQLLGHATDDLNSVGFDAKAWAERNGVAVGGKGQPKTAEEAFLKMFGVAPFYDMLENANNISAMQYLVGHVAMAPANALRGDIPALVLPLTAARGYLAPLRNRAFHIINNVTHGAARGEAFRLSFRDALNTNAEELLGAAEAMGRDTGELRNMGDAAGAGLFSPQMVQDTLGPEFAAEWQRMTDASVRAGFERANAVLGDFANKSAGERLVGLAVPLMSWSWRAYPRVAGLVLSHPAVAAATLQLYEAERRTGEAQHLPSYQYGTVAIPTDMPLLGALARVFTPQQEGAVRLNPLALINPVGGGALAMGTEESTGKQTPYQAAQGAVEAVGGSFNPLVTTLGYLTGGDYRAPGPLDRYANIDEAMNDLPGMQGTPTLPTIQAPLRAARKALGNAPDTYDVVEAKAKELVYERTGLPLADARNRDFARQVANKEGIYREAEHILDTSGATRAAFNAVTPVSVQMSTRTADERRQAAAAVPWTYEDIQRMQAINPTLANEMQREVDDYTRANPAAAIGKDAKLPKAGSMEDIIQQRGPLNPAQRAVLEYEARQAALAKKKK
jgi:hypothetical protein